MSKDIKPQQVVFDYNKLAEAIVKAEQNVKAEENKIDEATDVLKMLLTIVFFSVGATLIFVAIICFLALFIDTVSFEGIQSKLGYFVLFLLSFCYGSMSIYLHVKIKKIEDKSYLLNFFSAVTGLLALIVSVIALVKG